MWTIDALTVDVFDGDSARLNRRLARRLDLLARGVPGTPHLLDGPVSTTTRRCIRELSGTRRAWSAYPKTRFIDR